MLFEGICGCLLFVFTGKQIAHFAHLWYDEDTAFVEGRTV